jgi:hypothetical protein
MRVGFWVADEKRRDDVKGTRSGEKQKKKGPELPNRTDRPIRRGIDTNI